MYKQIVKTLEDLRSARSLLREQTGEDWQIRAHLTMAIGRLEQLKQELEPADAMEILKDHKQVLNYLESNGHSTLARFEEDLNG